VHVPKRPGEPDCTWADTTKITTQLGWKPTISFPEGVLHMLTELDKWGDAPLWDPQSIGEATKTWFRYMTPKEILK
jgi:UDP-glucose 4-epimerase